MRRSAPWFGNLINEQGTCGTHVHVAVPNLAAAARACSYIRPWLPALACLTANSPFTRGQILATRVGGQCCCLDGRPLHRRLR
ncbi:glutamate-cysteine ligase family protein [Luedemannella flava]